MSSYVRYANGAFGLEHYGPLQIAGPNVTLGNGGMRPRARGTLRNRFLQRLFYHQAKPGWPGVWLHGSKGRGGDAGDS
ncbi:MAG: hypothetical protein IPL78_31725 [Chloroflexi bacterium]|nr:hypothetical protein [Chloroflexota bacterium]